MIAGNENERVTEVSAPVSATSEGAIPTSDTRNLVDDVLDAVAHQALVDRIVAKWHAHCRAEDARQRRRAAFRRLLADLFPTEDVVARYREAQSEQDGVA